MNRNYARCFSGIIIFSPFPQPYEVDYYYPHLTDEETEPQRD